MHIFSKFKICIHIFAMVKLKNKTQHFESGKKCVFLQLIQSNVLKSINEIKYPYLFHTLFNYLDYQICTNIEIIKTLSVSKHKKSKVAFFKI